MRAFAARIGVLDRRPAESSLSRDLINAQGARPALADLLAEERQDGLLAEGKLRGELPTAKRACAMGLEGIVSKRIDAPYRSGPFLGWRKIKCPGYARP